MRAVGKVKARSTQLKLTYLSQTKSCHLFLNTFPDNLDEKSLKKITFCLKFGGEIEENCNSKHNFFKTFQDVAFFKYYPAFVARIQYKYKRSAKQNRRW